MPDRAREAEPESPRLETVLDQPQPADTAPRAEPTDAELEAAIVRAVTAGAFDVARTLAGRLEARRRPAAVVYLTDERSRRRR
jgi:hypothetical protein